MIGFNRSTLLNTIGALFAIYLAVILTQTFVNNYNLQKQVDTLNRQIDTLTIKNNELNYNIAYYNSASYQDKAARVDLNLQKPGENVIILTHPSNIADQKKTAVVKPKVKSNFAQWVDFFTGKG
jgi:cell division protein FtsB